MAPAKHSTTRFESLGFDSDMSSPEDGRAVFLEEVLTPPQDHGLTEDLLPF